MIAIGTTRKPTQRVRSFVKELNWVIPGSTRISRGKQGFMELCDSALKQGASRIVLVGAFHGNPGRLGFLEYNGEDWQFIPPTIIIKSVQLLRELGTVKTRRPTQLFVLAETPKDHPHAELLAQALETTTVQRDALFEVPSGSALLHINLRQPQTIAFLTQDQRQPLGPKLAVKHYLTRPMGDQKRW